MDLMQSETLKWKICGMKYDENIRVTAALEPAYLGFIFWNKSPRFLDGLIPEIPKEIKKTGVFVNATLETMECYIQQYDLQAVQLHGDESEAVCHYLKETGVEVIKAFAVHEDFDFSVLRPYENSCNFFLFDTKGKLPGGNGYAFDWKLLKNYPSSTPFFLSGGIGLESVSEIQKISRLELPLYGIDVNSQFETAPGLKNTEQLKVFKNELAACSIM